MALVNAIENIGAENPSAFPFDAFDFHKMFLANCPQPSTARYIEIISGLWHINCVHKLGLHENLLKFVLDDVQKLFRPTSTTPSPADVSETIFENGLRKMCHIALNRNEIRVQGGGGCSDDGGGLVLVHYKSNNSQTILNYLNKRFAI